jgi:hypothetical protein
MNGQICMRGVKKLTVRELIEELNIVAEKYGDNFEVVLSVDDDHSHSEINLDEVRLHSYFEHPTQKVALCGTFETYEEPEPLEDDE